MRQLLARLDDDLHRRLRQRAAAEGRSVNALVSEVLAAAVAEPDDRRAAVRARARLAGVLAPDRRPAAAPDLAGLAELAGREGFEGLAAAALDAVRAAG